MPPLQRPTATALVLLAGLAAGCRKAPEPAPAPMTTFNADSARLARARADSLARARAETPRRSAASTSGAAARSIADAPAGRQALTAVIHFDFDKSELSDEARATLDSKLPILRANPTLRLRIEGNTDERGTEEYNLALGQRRAAAAKRYLVNQGIAESRIETISYGEERPAAQGHDESAWAQNRRDEFEVTPRR